MKNGIAEIAKMPNKLNLNKKKNSLEDKHYEQGRESLINIDLIKDAPKDWNRFEPLSEEKLTELKSSIKDIGLQHAVILWEDYEKGKEKSYMCLSGHNRVRVYKQLVDEGFKEYQKIQAVVKGKHDIDPNTAQQIILDTNIAAREISKIEKSRAIIKKFTLLKERKDADSETSFIEVLEAEFGMKGRQIRRYRQLVSLIEEFQEMIDKGIISIETGCHIARLEKNYQEYLFKYINNDEDKIKFIKKASSKIKNHFGYKDIEILFETGMPKRIQINVKYLDKNEDPSVAKISVLEDDKDAFLKLLESIKEMSSKEGYEGLNIINIE